MDGNKKLKKTCTILMIINIFLTFYIFGMPKVYENKLHFTMDHHVIYSRNALYYKLDEDYTATDLDGEEVVLKEGEYLTYSQIDFPNENFPDIESHVCYREHRFSEEILDEAQYHDATEEYKHDLDEINKKIDENGERDYMLYRLAIIFWFVIPSQMQLIYYPCGIVGGLIAFAFEKHRFKRLSKKEAYKRFIVTDTVIAAIIITLTVLYMLNPITCR